jgi:hypothetical protein
VSVSSEYAEALARGIVASLRAAPPAGVPVRVVIRWFEGPDYLTIHALGTDEENDVPADDAWYPLEWPNEPREIERVDSILEEPQLAAAAVALKGELDDEQWEWEDAQPEALVKAAARVRDLVEEAGVGVAAHFTVGVCHFEGWGNANSVPRANPHAVVELLRERGLDPAE